MKIKKLILICMILVSIPVLLVAGGFKEKLKPEIVVVYASVDEENTKKLLDVFTEDTGIIARFIHLSSGPALARITAEEKHPQADVWLGAPTENHIIARERGLTIAYRSDVLDKVDARFKDPDGYWCSFYMNPIAFGINTEALARANAVRPVSWEDLLKPEYNDLIQMPTPQSSGTGYNILTSLIMLWGEEAAFAYLKRLNVNIQSYSISGTGPSEATAVGQCAIGIQFTPGFYKFIDEGYPMEIVFPREGVGYEAPAVSILKGAANEKAAESLVDWLLSQKGQDVLFYSGTNFYPVNPEAKIRPNMPGLTSLKIVDYDPQWAGKNKQRFVKRWVNEILAVE